jgi:urea carboxylase
MCVYGMEGPGGYQFVGRTLQMWNRWLAAAEGTSFSDGKPWLLRFFDQIRFYPVSADELLQIRQDFLHGKYRIKIEDAVFSLRDYNRFLSDEAASIKTFKDSQQAAFEAERDRWAANGILHYSSEYDSTDVAEDLALDGAGHVVSAHIAGNLWQVGVEVGAPVKTGDTLMIIESMKMEIAVTANRDGVVSQILCQPGQTVQAGQPLIVIETE